jgi:ribosome maturation factor RimP
MRDNRRHAQSRPGRSRDTGNGAAARERGARPAAHPTGPVIDPAELTTLLEPVVRAAGMDLESVRVGAAGRRRLLRLVVDSDGGVGLDEIADVSRDISARLDSSAVMGNAAYTLEVSSPGIDRPLTQARHWRRAHGRLVTVPLAGDHDTPVSSGKTADQSAHQVTGRVVTAGDSGVTLEVDGRYREFTYAQLGPGRVQVEFGKPGAGADGGEPKTAQPRLGEGGSADGH